MIDRLGNWLRNRASGRSASETLTETWMDVGAHHGEHTLSHALINPDLRVYAFEPNLAAAAKLFGQAPNYFAIPMAVAETDGTAELYINTFDAASSLLPFNDEALQSWIGGQSLAVASKVTVPTIRLDTFMNLMEVKTVEFLKIDTQGLDLSVVKSAGDRLQDIAKITLEVDITPSRLYRGAPSKDDVIAFLTSAGFSLVGMEIQSYGQEENLTLVRGSRHA